MNKYLLAPIVLFVYNRPWHTRQTLESLRQNILADQSQLIVYADGIKDTANDIDIKNIHAVRQIIREEQWCREVIIIESDKNQGLANSIIKGVTEVVNTYGKIIVLEDDMLTSKYFLQFMNDALLLYQDEEEIACVSGYVPLVKAENLFFIRGAEIWGWGTWKRAWELFEIDSTKLFNELNKRDLIYRFDMNGTLNCTDLLIAQIDGKVSSWGIRWYASAFLANKLHLYPPKTLIKNIGRDGTGTHEGAFLLDEPDVYEESIDVLKFEAKESKLELQLLINYFREKNKQSLYISLKSFVKKTVSKILSRSHNIVKSVFYKYLELKNKIYLLRYNLYKESTIFTHLTLDEKILINNQVRELKKRKKKDLVCVEIGSFLGASSCFICGAITKDSKLYCIDTWGNHAMKYCDVDTETERDTYFEFKENTLNYNDKIIEIRQWSTEAIATLKQYEQNIDFLFLDGDHSYEAVNKDWELYSPLLSIGSIVAFHDTGWAEGVKQVISESVITRSKKIADLPNIEIFRIEA
jgi:cephalosporin hydroxylase